MQTIRTADGYTVKRGDIVFDYYGSPMQWGIIVTEPDSDGWFDIRYADGTPHYRNGNRVSFYSHMTRNRPDAATIASLS